MLVTHDFGGEQSSEVIDLRNPDNVCSSFADAGPRQFPYGALMQKSLPVVCGGYSDQDCVIIGRDTTTPLVDLTLPRPESASVLIDESTFMSNFSSVPCKKGLSDHFSGIHVLHFS